MMSISIEELVQRNAAFAASGAFAGLPFPGNRSLRVVGCVDSRVDPGDVLGLRLGDAVVMRNIGGRITPTVLRSWALLGRLGQGEPPGGHWHLARRPTHATGFIAADATFGGVRSGLDFA